MPLPQTEKTAQQRAGELHAAGDLTAAAELLAAALAKRESSELWSGWGAVQASRGETGDADRAFRQALRMNAQCRPAAENLGVLLDARGQFGEAQTYLAQALTEVDNNRRVATQCTNCIFWRRDSRYLLARPALLSVLALQSLFPRAQRPFFPRANPRRPAF